MIFHPFSIKLLNIPVVTECQKNRTGVGITDIDMTHTVFLLVRTGKLMLFYDVIHVVINGCTSHNTGLRPSIHDLSVNIIHRSVFFDIDAVREHLLQVSSCPGVDAGIIVVYRRIEIDFRSVDM